MIRNSKRSFLLRGATLAAVLLASGNTWSQKADAWPTRPVTIVVGFGAGGPTDALARILAENLSTRFKQSFVVENKAGASGGVAAGLVKRAEADGYTLMFGSSSTLAILPTLQKTSYDPVVDFTPIGLVASYPYFLVVPASSPDASLDDLVKRGRQPAATLSYGSAGNGAVNHLAGEWFKHEARIDATHIPYRGDAAAVTDLIAGRLDFAFLAGAAAFAHVKSGKLRILAAASAKPGLGGPGVPTLGEHYKGFATEPWNGLMGPAGLPQPIVTQLNAAINATMSRPDVIARLAGMDQFPLTGTPQQFADHIQSQTARWATVIRTSGIQVN